VKIVYRLDHSCQASLAVYDAAGRQLRTLLTGQKQEAGQHTVPWDGLDRNGRPVKPGTYQWRLLGTPGFTRTFLVNVGTNPTWSAFDLWPGNHAGPTTLMVDREAALYAGSISAEGPPHLLKISMDGRRKYWDTGTWGLQDGLLQLARIDDALYLLYSDARLWIRRADSGSEFWGHPQRRKFAERHLPFADVLHPSDVRPMPGAKSNGNISPMCMATGKDHLVVTYEMHDEVRFLWPGVDRIIRTQTVHVAAPKGVAVAPDGRVFVVSGQTVVLVNAENGQVKGVVDDPEAQYPTRIAYDQAHNDLLVVQRGPGMSHVRRYSAADGRLVAMYGRKAGRTYGIFNPLDWDTILDIAADGHGGFVTVEELPRRVAHFRGREKHELVQQWLGGMQWGALSSLDPADPSTVYLFPDHKHCARGKIDYRGRTWTLTHLYELPENFSWNAGKESYRGMFPPFGGESYWSVRHVGTTTFLVNNGRLKGAEGVSVVRIDEKENRVVPVARLGVLHPTVDRLNPPDWWLAAMRRAGYDPARSGYDHFCYSWSDTNHNGKIDTEEIRLATYNFGYTESQFYIDEGWNVFRVVRPPNPGVTQPYSWLLVANTGSDPSLPAWDWDDARRPSRGELSPDEFGGAFPGLGGIFLSKGNIYAVGNAQSDERGPDIPPSTWPNNTTSASRFLKWNREGILEWSVGVHTDAKDHPPGVFSNIRGILGEARNCLVVLDACSPATVWTQDGLYAGSFLDGRAQDGLPDIAYQRIFGDDNQWSQVLETSTGEVFWGAMSDQSTLYYRIGGWDNWERHNGSITLEHTPSAARRQGTGLKAEYFNNTNLAGEPVLKRIDPDIWFGPIWGDHREVKARNGWFGNQEKQAFDPGSCSARWTGFIEAPVSEDFVFVLYAYGDRPGPNELLGSKVRLWIDGKEVIDEWDRVKFRKVTGWWRTRPCYSTRVRMHAGQLMPVKVEYAGTGGNEANLHLYWKSPSFDLRHVPQTALYPELKEKHP
jgi:hypothetical protein